MSVLWGITYLFIKDAVATFSPAAVVSGRTLLGAAVLLPLAIRRGALRPALRAWPWVLAFGAVEMGGPFLLLSDAEKTLPSGLTGLLVSTVPLFSAAIGFAVGHRASLGLVRVTGLLLGFGGVAVVVAGQQLAAAHADGMLVAVGKVLITAVMYAIVPFIVARRLQGVPSLGSVTLALAAVGLAYLPFALVTSHQTPSGRSILSLAVLGVVCTAVAFVAFFALIAEVGPVRSTLFTYVNPVVAVGLGIAVAGESLTWGLVAGFPLVLGGCWLAATGGRRRRAPASASPGPASPTFGGTGRTQRSGGESAQRAESPSER